MPTVPILRGRQVDTAALPGPRLSTSVPAGTFETAQVDLSGLTREVVGIARDERQKADQIILTEADGRLSALETQIQHDPKTGILNRRGQDAFTAPEDAKAAWDKGTAEIANSLSTESQKLAFRRAVVGRWASIDNSVQQHVSNERKRYDNTATDEGIVLERDAAIKNFTDPERIGQSIEWQQSALVLYAQRNGLPDAWVKDKVTDAASKTHVGVIEAMLIDPEKGGDRLAQTYYKIHSGELTGEDEVRIKDKLGSASTEGEALRAVDAVWVKNPEGQLTAMETAIRTKYKDEPKVIKAAIQELRSRTQAWKSDKNETDATNAATVLGAYNNGAPLSRLVHTAEYLALSGAEQEKIKSYIVDRGYTLTQRAEAEQAKRGFASYWGMSNPAFLSTLSDNVILAAEPQLGQALVGDLMRQKRALSGVEAKVRDASIDFDTLKHHLRLSGINPEDKMQEAKVGEIRYQVENAIDRVQEQSGKILSRTEKDVIMRSIVDQKVMLDRWGRRDTESLAALVTTDQRGKAYVPLAQVDPLFQTEALNWLRSSGLVLRPNATDPDLLKDFSSRIEHAFGARVTGASAAEIQAILRGAP